MAATMSRTAKLTAVWSAFVGAPRWKSASAPLPTGYSYFPSGLARPRTSPSFCS